MRISYVTMQFPAPAETFTCNDVRALRDSGATISVHALRAAHPMALTLTAERDLDGVRVTHGGKMAAIHGCGIAISRLGTLLQLLVFIMRHNWRRPEHMLKSLLLVPRAVQILSDLQAKRPDVVHLCWGHYPSLVGFLVQTYLPDVVVSVSLVAYDLEAEYGGTAPVADKADMIRTVASVNVQAIVDTYGVAPEAISVLYDGVDMRRFAGVSFAQKKVPRRIVTAARLIPSKSVNDVLEVFAKLVERWPDATLVVLGDGPEMGGLKAYARTLGIQELTTFRGHISHDVVFEEMAKAEVFLFMSRKSGERLPNVVKEAMGCRCLCIVTDTPGIQELVVDGKHGFVVPQGDVAGACQLAGRIFEDVAARKTMIDAAHRHLEANFDLQRIIAEYCERWQRLVRNKRSGLKPATSAAKPLKKG